MAQRLAVALNQGSCGPPNIATSAATGRGVGRLRRAPGRCAADAVVILDVLHYLDPQEQLEVLRRVRVALPARGLLLMRVGDAGAGLRFRYGQCSDKLVMLLRGHSIVTQHCRSVAQ